MSALADLAAQAASCTRCELYRRATATVFGEGRAGASLLLVGEQPGDQEDRQGRPFVGPAGRLLDRALADGGISREDAYVTNAVKHFKWQAAGKRRIHQRPTGAEVMACRYWLEGEVAAVGPQVVVALGATAGTSLFGSAFRVGQHRGHVEEAGIGPWHGLVVSTIHPSAVLRAPDGDARARAYEGFVADLRLAGSAAAGGAGVRGLFFPFLRAPLRAVLPGVFAAHAAGRLLVGGRPRGGVLIRMAWVGDAALLPAVGDGLSERHVGFRLAGSG